ncbi:MAG: methyltransferase domain-containing protein [Gaiellaceae bacterium]
MNSALAAWLAAVSGSDEEFVEHVWPLVLRREPEPDARGRALAKLRMGTLSRATLLRELVSSEEFERVALLDDALALAAGARRARARPRGLRGPAGTDERVIEIPWCLARYCGERRVLDVGYAFAEPSYLAGLTALGAAELVGADLAGAQVPGLRSVVADARSLPFDDNSFELEFCISTLEHVGRDNEVYGGGAEQDEQGAGRALRELHRALVARGRLLVSVPCGEEQDLGWQVQRPPADWLAVFEAAGFLVFEDELYELGREGWRATSRFEAAGVRYGERGPGASAVLCAELRPSGLAERVRLAVRDLRHRDEPRRSTRGD